MIAAFARGVALADRKVYLVGVERRQRGDSTKPGYLLPTVCATEITGSPSTISSSVIGQ